MVIRPALPADAPAVAALMCALWPEHAPEEMEREARGLLRDEEALIVLCEQAGQAVGFAQCGLRHDYVEGTHGGPVGYLEGVFVLPAHRRRGVARALVRACCEWARTRGCREFASDCELENADSLAFHLGVGFQEANRVICFVRRL